MMNTLFSRGHVLAFSALFALIPSLASATVVSSVDRATFQTAVNGGTVIQQNFDSLAAGTILGATADVTYGASLGSPVVTANFLTTTFPNGLGSTSAGYFLAGETATFFFNNSTTAFAIDINTYATSAGAYTASLDTGDIVNSIYETFPNTSTGEFIGFVSAIPFSSVTIASRTGFSYTLDTLVYGDAAAVTGPTTVPEPGSLAMYGVGLLALVGLTIIRRRRA